ncbi:MAG: class C sortase [Bilifractor sp.]|jgi:sortase A
MRKKKDKGRAVRIFSGIGFIACSIALLYPVISNAWNRYRDSKLITRYIEEVNDDSREKELCAMWQAAETYNQQLARSTDSLVTEKQFRKDSGYESLLNPEQDGMMGYIEIPCIDVREIIYHYSTDEVLENGVGHILGSSLPVGGSSTHCVITGHRGLPGRKFFSDLDKVGNGDRFYIHILGKTLAYEVYDIRTVLPDDVSSLKIEDGKDLVTLVTCTPYGINSHRLLITGKRIPFDDSNVGENGLVTNEKHKKQIDPAVYVFLGFVLFIILVILIRKVRGRKEKDSSANASCEKSGPEKKDGSPPGGD